MILIFGRFVKFVKGPGRQDATCMKPDVSLPHVLIGTTPQTSERMFSAGNERTRLSFPQNGASTAGYMLTPEDKMHLIVDLMNTDTSD
jgi:hypothetical protein